MVRLTDIRMNPLLNELMDKVGRLDEGVNNNFQEICFLVSKIGLYYLKQHYGWSHMSYENPPIKRIYLFGRPVIFVDSDFIQSAFPGESFIEPVAVISNYGDMPRNMDLGDYVYAHGLLKQITSVEEGIECGRAYGFSDVYVDLYEDPPVSFDSAYSAKARYIIDKILEIHAADTKDDGKIPTDRRFR